MFEKMEMREKWIIYWSLKCMIESGEHDGEYLHNADAGHPVYAIGATGKLYPEEAPPDSPERNHVFKMISELSKVIKAEGATGYVGWYDFSEWKSFCEFLVTNYRKRRQ